MEEFIKPTGSDLLYKILWGFSDALKMDYVYIYSVISIDVNHIPTLSFTNSYLSNNVNYMDTYGDMMKNIKEMILSKLTKSILNKKVDKWITVELRSRDMNPKSRIKPVQHCGSVYVSVFNGDNNFIYISPYIIY